MEGFLERVVISKEYIDNLFKEKDKYNLISHRNRYGKEPNYYGEYCSSFHCGHSANLSKYCAEYYLTIHPNFKMCNSRLCFGDYSFQEGSAIYDPNRKLIIYFEQFVDSCKMHGFSRDYHLYLTDSYNDMNTIIARRTAFNVREFLEHLNDRSKNSYSGGFILYTSSTVLNDREKKEQQTIKEVYEWLELFYDKNELETIKNEFLQQKSNKNNNQSWCDRYSNNDAKYFYKLRSYLADNKLDDAQKYINDNNLDINKVYDYEQNCIIFYIDIASEDNINNVWNFFVKNNIDIYQKQHDEYLIENVISHRYGFKLWEKDSTNVNYWFKELIKKDIENKNIFGKLIDTNGNNILFKVVNFMSIYICNYNLTWDHFESIKQFLVESYGDHLLVSCVKDLDSYVEKSKAIVKSFEKIKIDQMEKNEQNMELKKYEQYEKKEQKNEQKKLTKKHKRNRNKNKKVNDIFVNQFFRW